MKKFLTLLVTLVALTFLCALLYVFELPPFNPGGLLLPAAAENSSQQTQQLPGFLSDEKIGRAKTYNEHLNHGKLYEENGFHGLAVAEYEAASKLEPNAVTPYLEIGRINLREKDFIKAKLSFEQALQLEPNNLEAKVYLVRSLLADRKVAEAKKIIDGLSIHNQTSKYYEGIIAAYFGEYDKSKNILKETVSIGGNDEITGKAQNFLSAYDEFDFNQGGSQVHLKALLARSFNQVGEYNMAIPLLFEVIKEKKDYRDAWILLGYAYLNIEKFQDAAEALEEAKKLDPQKSETLFFLGLSYYGLNDLNKAAENLELAKKNGFQPQVQIDQKLAEIYLQLKNYKNSAQSYENVISLNDKDVNYFIKPVWIYLDRLNLPDKAVVLAQKALKSHPGEAMSYNIAGWAYTGANKLVEAEDYLNKALSMDPHMDAIYLNFGILNEKKGLAEKAIAFYKKAFEMGHGNGISSAAADHYNRLIGKTDNLNYTTLKASVLTQ